MDASTRLYTRLGEIPEDPNDPESLAELLVCAFGAFERYYVCWKTQSGGFRQDGHDLPSALKDWLYPADGTTRDFATLQVVFGRGEEYFASDKDGKLEYKEPEVKKPQVDEEKDKPSLRRARTVSFLRPLADVSTRPDPRPDPRPEPVPIEVAESRRSSSTSSRRTSRPPSLSFSRTSSEISFASNPSIEQQQNPRHSRTLHSSLLSQWMESGSTSPESDAPASPNTRPDFLSFGKTIESIPEQDYARPKKMDVPSARTPRQMDVDRQQMADFKVPKGYKLVPIDSEPSITPSNCTCGCHSSPLPIPSKSTYVEANSQTDIIPSPPRTALRIDTSSASSWSGSVAVREDLLSPVYDDTPADNPIFIGRGLGSYFSKPGYQLGDSLMGSYTMYHQPVIYQYQDEFGEEALRD
ncbi:hypothetical protein GQ44DRAFT_239212 [Phaeosphaeriaceae sp. PMI808]|nr:hypothetical protein GQ44DRAFT_239212 [Phaeosphaeriaceae sp. PMI808]